MPKKRRMTKKRIPLTESYSSLLLGIVVIIIIVLIVMLFMKKVGNKPTIGISSTSTVSEEQLKKQGEQNSPSVREEDYIVKEGDSLWIIAQNKYENGDNWVEIAENNNLQIPDQIDIGQKLTLPRIETKTLSTSTGPSNQANAPPEITSTTYTVQEDDYLWEIAQRAYNDPYKWSEIANANNLINPDLIYPGTVLAIPR